MNSIRVVLADDHPIVRSGIRGLVERASDIQVVGEAASGKEALAMVTELAPDVLLLDMELSDMNGMEVMRQLQQEGCSVKILVLSAHDDPNYLTGLIEYGAVGYLLKEEAPQVIIDAVRGVARGEEGWVSRGVAAHMLANLRGEEKGVKLTKREMEVLRFVTEGKTNQNIAVQLGISDKTVEKYLDAIFQKLEVHYRTEAAVYAVREGIIS
jgi:DNA-binding NarL/FixJ family response regulator